MDFITSKTPMKSKALASAILATLIVPSEARWKPEYASQPQEVRDWYASRQLTEAARARFGFQSCCDKSDVVDTKFKVNKTTGGDEWFWWDGKSWQQVPPDIIHKDENAPGGQAVLFALPDGRPTCFYPPEGGI